MEQMIDVYYRIVATSGYRERERLYEKARHDEAQALYHAKNEGRKECDFEIAQNMKAEGFSLHDIAKLTGLSYAEVENL